ncbi:DegT/DnrJ/EryC1/StrS family aminotransferase [Streptomyces boninensis]|uniref:DegT/DnrJ/EryC1/StrS family aminotransferase n=1 Tax=Streptomyces boninensis TaxID=2039455 RepID=UPI003B20C853
MQQRLDRECVYVPSGRFGLYLALRQWCPPGGRLLMSPLDDDVLLFLVHAAGLRPVMAPVDPRDGNIAPEAVPEATWRGLAGVMTTNLYGLPDRVEQLKARCDRHGIPLIEDAAHALGITVGGRPVGTFGQAAVFSLAKHAGARTGGVLACAGRADRLALEALRDELLAPGRLAAELDYQLRPRAERLLRRIHMTRAARQVHAALGRAERPPGSYRMKLHPDRLRAAIARGPGLDHFDAWLRVDLHDWRRRQGRLRLRAVDARVRRVDERREQRIAAARLLASTGLAAEGVGEALEGPDGPPALFRVPLLVTDRDRWVDVLDRHDIATGYLYDAPLDDYAGPEFAEPSPDPEPARWFARHVLPVDPLGARAAHRLLTAGGAAAAPAFPRPNGSIGSAA